MNINDLTEDQLNTLAALGQNLPVVMKKGCPCFVTEFDPETPAWIHDVKEWKCYIKYDPCNNGSQAMELVEEYDICFQKLDPEVGGEWNAAVSSKWNHNQYANNPKLAIVRAFVASKYGTEIDFEKIVGGSDE